MRILLVEMSFVKESATDQRMNPETRTISRSCTILKTHENTMQLLHLLLAVNCAAGSPVKSGMRHAPETRQLALPPPVTVNGLKPFQFPTDYNASAPYYDGTPESWLYCSKTSEWITPSYVNELIGGSVLESASDNAIIPSKTGWVWYVPLNEQSSQVYACNYNRLFRYAISAGIFRGVNVWLDQICGVTMAGYMYFDTPWDVAIGRNSTDPQGYPRPQCGGEWA